MCGDTLPEASISFSLSNMAASPDSDGIIALTFLVSGSEVGNSRYI